MTMVLRNFRDKEVPGILKIAESLKTDVVDFSVQVPIIQALRTDGMKQRHWEMITKSLGFELVQVG
jgi:dynein heavy chain